MEIVIKINEDAYNLLEQKYRNGKADVLDCIILNGNILPKGHGRIIDESKITSVYYHEETYKSTVKSTVRNYHMVIDGTDAPTIIEADER